jgi:hypothetical protein
LATPFLVPRSLFLLHDTWPETEEFADPGRCGDSYKAPVRLRSLKPGWSWVTMPVYPGLTIGTPDNNGPKWLS